jgi:hypothetical protein
MNTEINLIINYYIYPISAIMAALSLLSIAIDLGEIRKKIK